MFRKVGVEHSEISKPPARVLLIPMLCTEHKEKCHHTAHTPKEKWRSSLQSHNSFSVRSSYLLPEIPVPPFPSSLWHTTRCFTAETQSRLCPGCTQAMRGTGSFTPKSPQPELLRTWSLLSLPSHHISASNYLYLFSLLTSPQVMLTSMLDVPVLFPSQATSHPWPRSALSLSLSQP